MAFQTVIIYRLKNGPLFKTQKEPQFENLQSYQIHIHHELFSKNHEVYWFFVLRKTEGNESKLEL